VNDTTQIADFNPGFGPAVSHVDSGNGFGTRVFWTAVVPDDAVRINLEEGTAELHVHNLFEFEYVANGSAGNVSLGPKWQTAFVPATVSFDVVWNGPVTRRVHVKDSTYGFDGRFSENQATVTWSGRNALGFSFTAKPGNFSTSLPEVAGVNGVTQPLNFFAELAHERNGIFFSGGDASNAANALSPDALLAIGPSDVSTPAGRGTGVTQAPPAAVHGSGVLPEGALLASARTLSSESSPSRPVPNRIIDHMFAGLDWNPISSVGQGDEIAGWAL
jgi:hypothetical protein